MASDNSNLSSHDKAVLNKIFNPNLPFNDVLEGDSIDKIDEVNETEDEKEAKRMELDGVQAAEQGNLDLSLELFTKAIQLAPHRASGFNNRAQSWQLKGNIPAAMDDLEKALEISQGKGTVACKAFTQRGIIHKFQKKEDEALADFKSAAALRSEFAKQQVVSMNPYAALCNKMMAEMIGKVQAGEA